MDSLLTYDRLSHHKLYATSEPFYVGGYSVISLKCTSSIKQQAVAHHRQDSELWHLLTPSILTEALKSPWSNHHRSKHTLPHQVGSRVSINDIIWRSIKLGDKSLSVIHSSIQKSGCSCSVILNEVIRIVRSWSLCNNYITVETPFTSNTKRQYMTNYSVISI